MDYLTTPSTEKVLLERVRIGAQQCVPSYVLRNMELATWEDHLTASVVMSFRSEVLAQKLDQRTIDKWATFKVPTSWWQMFKLTYALTWWLAWLVKRRPVRFVEKRKCVTVEASTHYIYPDANLALPEDGFGKPYFVQVLR